MCCRGAIADPQASNRLGFRSERLATPAKRRQPWVGVSARSTLTARSTMIGRLLVWFLCAVCPAPAAAGERAAPPSAERGVMIRLAPDHRIEDLFAFERPASARGRYVIDDSSILVRTQAATGPAGRPVIVRSACRVPPANAELARRLGLDRHYVIEPRVGRDAAPLDAAFEADLRGTGGVASIARLAMEHAAHGFAHGLAHGLARGLAGGHDGTLEPDNGSVTNPSDALFPSQYALLNTGQIVGSAPGTPRADIRAAEAWEIESGSDGVIVAVLDGGISVTHPDLQGKLVPGANMFCPPGSTYCDPGSTDDQMGSHGTHVAGIIAANSDNGEGIAGVSWGSRVMPVVVLSPFGFGTPELTANGIIWAADHGADVISLSLGHSADNAFLRDAVRYAHESGAVICASTGNIPSEPIGYPARYPEVIAVAATDHTDSPASFNSTGPELSVVAPGVEIWSAWDAISGPGQDTYHTRSGTSQAQPHVAGLAALLLSAKPGLTNEQVRGVIELTAEDLGEPGWDPGFGHGRIDALAALRAVTTPRLADLDGDGLPEWGAFDVDGNGSVDLEDGYAWYRTPVDVNADGIIDSRDLRDLTAFTRRNELADMQSARDR